jgi:hemoglobin/transferrin/lactoferrin receptor protein
VPDVDDLSKIFETAAGSVIVPNADLQPEKTINTELGVTKIFNNRTRWENTIYYTHFIDAIVTDKFTLNGQDSVDYDGTMSQVYANQNKGEAFLYGFSSILKSQLDKYFLFSVMMNYTYGRIKTDGADMPLDHIPPFMSRLAMTYTNNNFSSDFFVNYNGWKKLKNYNLGGEDNEQYATEEGMPAWFTINLHSSYKVGKYLTVQAGVDNIFDTQYRTFASGINAPGRNIFVALRGSF